MRLLITTPDTIVADLSDIAAVRAEDESGEFGIRPRHADLVTALVPSVLGWRRADGGESYCAVRGGLLTVTGGQAVSVATREAVRGDDLAALETVVRERMAAKAAEETRAHGRAEQMRMEAIRQIVGYLRPRAPLGDRR